ncbi:MAG: HI0074 family nucleotidyltransferase substrate-binding subunit [Candidatus Saccharimonadales bacterium]
MTNAKLAEQKAQLGKARDFLNRVLAAPENEIQRAAAIQAFEFSFELSWKYLKTLLEADGKSIFASPRAIFRDAAQHGFIDNPEQWFGFLEYRNLTAHTYVEAVAEKVYAKIQTELVAALDELINIKA